MSFKSYMRIFGPLKVDFLPTVKEKNLIGFILLHVTVVFLSTAVETAFALCMVWILDHRPIAI